MSAHAFLAGAEQSSRQKPFMDRDVAALVQGADCGGELFAAILALVDARPRALALHLSRVADDTAMRADRTIRPTCRLEMPPSGLFVVKNRVRQINGHGAPQRFPFL